MHKIPIKQSPQNSTMPNKKPPLITNLKKKQKKYKKNPKTKQNSTECIEKETPQLFKEK